METSAFDNHQIFITPEQNKTLKHEVELSSSGQSDLLGTSETKRGFLYDFPDNEHDIDAVNTPKKAKIKFVKFASDHMSSKHQIKSPQINRIVGNVQTLLDETEELNKIVQNQDCKIREFEKEQKNHLELVSKYQSLRDENEKLKEILKEKEIEIRKQSCEGQLITFENGRSNRLIEVLKDKICVLQTELDQLAFERMKKVDLCKQLFVEVRKLNLMICQLKEEINTYKKENEELKALVQEKTTENERLSKELDNLNAKDQSEILEISKISSQVDNITNETKNLRHMLSQKDQGSILLQIGVDELGENTKAISESQAKLALISDENLRLNTEIYKLNEMAKNKTEDMEVKILELLDEREKLVIIFRSTQEENEKLSKERERLEINDKNQKLVISNLQDQMHNMANEAKNISLMLLTKEQECQLLKREINELEESKQSIIELQKTNENLRLLEEIDHLNEMLENKTKKMEIKVSELMGEKESLDDMLKSTKEEMEAMMKEKERMMNEHIQEINNAKVREQYLLDEISKCMNKIEEMQKLFGVVQNKGNFGEKDPLKDLIQKANRGLEEVLVRVRSKIQEVAGLQHKLAEEMEQIKEDRFRIEKMKQEMNNLEVSLKSVKNENIKLQNGVTYFMSIFA